MSVQRHDYWIIACDSCPERLRNGMQFSTLAQAEEEAKRAGWEFHQLPGKNRTEICHDCAYWARRWRSQAD